MVLCLSIDGASEEAFELTRPDIKWSRMLDILRLIKEAGRTAGPEKRFRLTFNVVGLKNSISDLPNLVRLGAECGTSSIYVVPLMDEKSFPKTKGQSLYDCPEILSPAFLHALPIARKHGIDLSVPFPVRSQILLGQERGQGIKGKILWLWRFLILMKYYLLQKGLKQSLVLTLKKFSNSLRKDKIGINFCRVPWENSYFASDGRVYPCCSMGYLLGDLTQSSWQDVWNGSHYRNLRRTIHGWNPTAACRYCGLPMGIFRSDAKRYERFFSRFRSQAIPLDDPSIERKQGFYELEYTSSGNASHIWMSQKGRLAIPKMAGAKFLRILIIPRAPVDRINPGSCRINNGEIHYFDNSCLELHFPIDRIPDKTLELELNMDNAYDVPPDPRSLSLAIRGIEFLF